MPKKIVLKVLPAVLLIGLLFSPAASAAGDSGMGWGYDFYGQLGNGAAETALPCQCLKAPTPIGGLASATQISASQNHTLALLADGTIRAWGANTSGQLGDGTTTSSAAGTPVGGIASAIAVAAGSNHSLALLADGTVMAWGGNGTGQLGIGNSSGPETCSAIPCDTRPAVVPGLSGVVAIAAGRDYSVALLSNGAAVAWGVDQFGQLGDGTGIQAGCKCIDHPVPVPGLSSAMAISAGAYETLALLADGSVRAWGRNVSGGLGNGTTTAGPCECLGPVAVSGLSGVKAVAAGGLHGMALLAGGTVEAWGANESGQLGNGAVSETGCKCAPTPASVGGLAGVQGIAAGIKHSLALLADGSVRAWGFNESGQLGNGGISETGCKCVPALGAASGLGGVTAISAGEINSYALIGAAQTLSVSLAGAGAGTVGGPTGILCGAGCSARYPLGQLEILRAEPAAGSAFAGFSGACAGTGGMCQLRMDGDKSVTATFGPPKGTAITAVKVNNRKKTAELTFSAPGAITGYECKLNRPKPKKPKKPKRKGGHGKGHGQKAGPPARRKTGGHKQPTPVFAGCAAPTTYKNLRPGGYTFEVRALDILGADANPASVKFKVKAPKPKHKHRHKPRS